MVGLWIIFIFFFVLYHVLAFLQWKYITSVTRIKNTISHKELWTNKPQRHFLWLPNYNLMEADTVLCNISCVISCLFVATSFWWSTSGQRSRWQQGLLSSWSTLVSTGCQPCRKESLRERMCKRIAMILSYSGYICILSLDSMLLIDRLIGGHVYFYQLPCVYLAGKNCSQMACAVLIDNEFAIARGIQAKSQWSLIMNVTERLLASYKPAWLPLWDLRPSFKPVQSRGDLVARSFSSNLRMK